MLCFYCTQTHMKLQSVFSREIFNTIFARLPPLASAARRGPHPLSTPVVFSLALGENMDDVSCASNHGHPQNFG